MVCGNDTSSLDSGPGKWGTRPSGCHLVFGLVHFLKCFVAMTLRVWRAAPMMWGSRPPDCHSVVVLVIVKMFSSQWYFESGERPQGLGPLAHQTVILSLASECFVFFSSSSISRFMLHKYEFFIRRGWECDLRTACQTSQRVRGTHWKEQWPPWVERRPLPFVRHSWSTGNPLNLVVVGWAHLQLWSRSSCGPSHAMSTPKTGR